MKMKLGLLQKQAHTPVDTGGHRQKGRLVVIL
jgi:hypothetical protein